VEDDIRRQIGELQVSLDAILRRQKDGNMIPQIKNNLFSSKLENCKKASSVDANTDKIVTMTQDSINEQKQTLADIAKHKDEAAKQIEDTLHKAVAKILKEETHEPAKVEEPKPVRKTRISQAFEQVHWPLNQSFDNPIVAISSNTGMYRVL